MVLSWILLLFFFVTEVYGADLGGAKVDYLSQEVRDHRQARNDYGRLCSTCHGDKGEGMPPLRGLSKRYTQTTLTSLITYTMPKNQANLCVGGCAEGMAAMLLDEAFEEPELHCDPDSFNSMEPQQRGLRLLTRLEYKNTVSDLLSLDASRQVDKLIPDDFVVNHFQTDPKGVYTKQHAYGYFYLAKILAKQAPPLTDLAPECHNDYKCQLATFGLRAFRRPLTETEMAQYQSIHNQYGDEAMIQAFLASPHLLYRKEWGQPIVVGTKTLYRLDNYEVASLLSYTFWKTMPDDIALAKASRDQLSSTQELASEAKRLLSSPKARKAFRVFWDGLYGLQRSISANLPPEVKADIRDEMLRFVEDIVFEQKGNLDDLLSSTKTFLNGRLAEYYGVALEGDHWQPYDWGPQDRIGLLGKAHFFAINSTTTSSHPVKRGLFIREMLLCQDFPPPPEGAELKPSKDPNHTTREKFEISHRQAACHSCHQFIDGVGFGLESYDQYGRFREWEKVLSGILRPIDPRGGIGSLYGPETVLSPKEPVLAFTGIKELSQLLRSSPNSRACFARNLYRFHVGERVSPAQACTLSVFGKNFRQGDQSILDLLVAYTQTLNFTYRQ